MKIDLNPEYSLNGIVELSVWNRGIKSAQDFWVKTDYYLDGEKSASAGDGITLGREFSGRHFVYYRTKSLAPFPPDHGASTNVSLDDQVRDFDRIRIRVSWRLAFFPWVYRTKVHWLICKELR